AEGEDAAVGGDQPVAAAVGGGGHADDGLVEVEAAGGAVEPGVAEGEDAAVGGDEPVVAPGGGGGPAGGAGELVAAPVGGGGHADDGLVEVEAAGGAVEPGVAEGEDAAV